MTLKEFQAAFVKAQSLSKFQGRPTNVCTASLDGVVIHEANSPREMMEWLTAKGHTVPQPERVVRAIRSGLPLCGYTMQYTGATYNPMRPQGSSPDTQSKAK